MEAFFYHGSLPQMDAEKLLERDGGFLLYNVYISGFRLKASAFLLFRKEGRFERIEVERVPNVGYRFFKVPNVKLQNKFSAFIA